MGVFSIKHGDTRPLLEVALKNPDGTVHDLTGSTAWRLHIRITSATMLTRDMTVEGAPTLGVLRYAWQASDWDAGQLPAPAALYSAVECEMEYEVTGGSSTLTFPNASFDTLRITKDLG